VASKQKLVWKNCHRSKIFFDSDGGLSAEPEIRNVVICGELEFNGESLIGQQLSLEMFDRSV